MADEEIFPTPEPDFVKGLGEVTLYFSQLELMLKLSIISLLTRPGSEPEDTVHRSVVSEMPFKPLVQVFKTLYAARYDTKQDSIADMERVVKAIVQVQDKRNEVIHSGWSTTAEPSIGFAFRFKLKGMGIGVVSRNTKPGELQEIASSINKACHKLYYLMRDYDSNFGRITTMETLTKKVHASKKKPRDAG